jgi:hypothetical protein
LSGPKLVQSCSVYEEEEEGGEDHSLLNRLVYKSNTLNMFYHEIKYHNCHTGLATYHKHNFSVFMPMPQKVHKVALKVFQLVFCMHCVDKTMHHHKAHVCVWMQRSLHDTGWPFIAKNTHKPFNVWMQRSLHGTGWPFIASNTQTI